MRGHTLASFTPQEIEQFLQQFFDTVGARQYIGARYVPIFGRKGEDTVEWDDVAPYEPLTVVMHLGVSYVSRQYVPTGTPITDTDFWVETYRFNAQVEQYREEVLSFQDQIDDRVPFPDADFYPRLGTVGQLLSTLGDGTTKWMDPVIVTSDVAGPLIDEWLDEHPEATTTVQNGAVTTPKLYDGAVTKSKMSQNGVPLESYGQMGLAAALSCNVTGTGYHPPVMQGSFYSSFVWSTATNQVTTMPVFLPKGARLDVVAVTKPQGATLFLNPYSETGYMEGTFTRGTQVNLAAGDHYVADSDLYVTIGSYLAGGITPSDLDIEVTVNLANDVTRAYVDSLRDNVYLRQVLPEISDANLMTSIGTYSVNASHDNVPSGMTGNGILMSLPYSNTRKTQVISVGGNDPQMFFRTWRLDAGNANFSPWLQLYPAILQRKVRLTYSSANTWVIDLGNVTMRLKHVIDPTDDADLWNVLQVTTTGDNPTQLDYGDIIGPVKIAGASDYTFGYHGSSTTTKIYIYADGSPVTLGSSTNVECEKLTIGWHDEGRHPDTLAHVMDRDVVIDFTKNRMHVWNTFKNVSGGPLSIANACNGGLLACYTSLIQGVFVNNDVYNAPYTQDLPASESIIMCKFMMGSFTMGAKNIIGHDGQYYSGRAYYYGGSNARDKVYFFNILNGEMADGKSNVGEFEYTYE